VNIIEVCDFQKWSVEENVINVSVFKMSLSGDGHNLRGSVFSRAGHKNLSGRMQVCGGFYLRYCAHFPFMYLRIFASGYCKCVNASYRNKMAAKHAITHKGKSKVHLITGHEGPKVE